MAGCRRRHRDGLAIPRSAVIDTGTRKIVFVESAPGIFDLREVTLGVLSSDDLYPVLGGLKEGDRVVTAGAFRSTVRTGLIRRGIVGSRQWAAGSEENERQTKIVCPTRSQNMNADWP